MCKSKLYGGMGFRQLHEFNLALLGKQGWRLTMNPDSLVSMIYKARYYPEGNFLNAKIGASPSFIWRSIMAAQELVIKGLGCRVGNGTSVPILNNPWLPDTINPYVNSASEALEGQMVLALMVTNEQRWDIDLIQDLFDSRDANLIMAIPLHSNEDDRWYWRKEKCGVYSVKSAYTLIQESKTYQQVVGNTKF